jgi:hypothetical protein
VRDVEEAAAVHLQNGWNLSVRVRKERESVNLSGPTKSFVGQATVPLPRGRPRLSSRPGRLKGGLQPGLANAA